MSHIRRRLDRLGRELGGDQVQARAQVRALPDAEILDLLARAAAEPQPTTRELVERRDEGTLGLPYQGRWALVSDDELLQRLADARAAVAAQGKGTP